MYTRCPYCHTYFKVLAEHIKKAGGKVRCGQCYKVFNSIGNLIEKLPVPLSEKGEKRPPEPQQNTQPPAQARADEQPGHTDIPSTPVDGAHMRSNKPDKAQYKTKDSIESIMLSSRDKVSNIEDGARSQNTDLIVHPDFGITDDEQDHRENSLVWGIGMAVLLGFFVLQYSYFYRADLAQHDSLKPWIESLCEIASCKIPDKLDIRAIKLTRRDITTHPKIDNALLISASIVNDADITQPFPVMRIRLSDTVGQILASRKFNPQEYLDANVNLKKGMPPGNPVQINLEIIDPGKNAINFEFDFFYPRT